MSRTGGRGPGPYGLQDRALLEELLGEQVGVAQLLMAGLGQADGQDLTLVVPLVERLAGGDALVALEADERGGQRPGQGLGRRRLAHAGLTFEQYGLAEGQRKRQRSGQAVVGQVADLVQAALQLDRSHGHRTAGSHGSAQTT